MLPGTDRRQLLQTLRRAGTQPWHWPGNPVVTKDPGFRATSHKGVCTSTVRFTHRSGIGPAGETSALTSVMDGSRGLKTEKGSSMVQEKEEEEKKEHEKEEKEEDKDWMSGVSSITNI